MAIEWGSCTWGSFSWAGQSCAIAQGDIACEVERRVVLKQQGLSGSAELLPAGSSLVHGTVVNQVASDGRLTPAQAISYQQSSCAPRRGASITGTATTLWADIYKRS